MGDRSGYQVRSELAVPYIAKDRRERYANYEQMPPETGGDLNYVVSRIVARYTEYHGLSYGTITEVRGALMGALDEYNRLVAHPYEDVKRDLNGDVWGILT